MQMPHRNSLIAEKPVIIRKLIVISGSTRILKEPRKPVFALERFDGVFVRQIRKYEKQLRSTDILIISPVYGLVNARDKIFFRKPMGYEWDKFRITESQANKIRRESTRTFQRLFSRREYSEIYLNVGRNMLRLLPSIEKLSAGAKVIYAEGCGIGPKMAHMKKWLELQTSQSR
jgi:hypothetical protein